MALFIFKMLLELISVQDESHKEYLQEYLQEYLSLE